MSRKRFTELGKELFAALDQADDIARMMLGLTQQSCELSSFDAIPLYRVIDARESVRKLIAGECQTIQCIRSAVRPNALA